MKYPLVIFDWDGTLMDSAGRIVSAMQSAATQCDLPEPCDDSVRNIIGLSLDVAINTLFPSIDEERVAQMVVQYKDRYRHHDTTPSPMFEGAQQLLQDLNCAGYKLAVATGKSIAGLERVWEVSNTKHYFHTARGSDQAQSKPSPDMLKQILQELSFEPHEAVMIGDTEYDLSMAKAIGMDRIGVSFGAHAVDRLAQHSPVTIVDSLRQLREWL